MLVLCYVAVERTLRRAALQQLHIVPNVLPVFLWREPSDGGSAGVRPLDRSIAPFPDAKSLASGALLSPSPTGSYCVMCLYVPATDVCCVSLMRNVTVERADALLAYSTSLLCSPPKLPKFFCANLTSYAISVASNYGVIFFCLRITSSVPTHWRGSFFYRHKPTIR